ARTQADTMIGNNTILVGPFSSAYDRYEIVFKNLVLSTDGGIVVRLGPLISPDAGNNYDYAFTENGAAAVTASSADVIALGGSLIGSDSNEDGISLRITADSPGASGKWKRITWQGAYRTSTGTLVNTQGVGEWKNTSASEYLTFYAS